jgi:hypothetical protein
MLQLPKLLLDVQCIPLVLFMQLHILHLPNQCITHNQVTRLLLLFLMLNLQSSINSLELFISNLG